MAGQSSRSRVYEDRLWDAEGREWRATLGRWATPDDVAQLLASGTPVVVHGFGREFRTLTGKQSTAFWSNARQHFTWPGQFGAGPDDSGLTYAAQVWSREEDQILGFVEFC